MVITPEKPPSKDALVCELINRETKEWDRDKINQWFLPEDRDEILSIPLSTTSNRDRLIWAENWSGKFTVKSAYLLALEEQKQSAVADCSNAAAWKRLWKTIWSLNIPQKIKFFVWKASRDILASKQNLARRKITENGVCDLCGDEEESTCHLLWFWDHAKEVWRNSKFALPFEISASWKFMDVLENLQRCEHLRPGLLEQVTTVCWGIWKNRNDLRMGGKGKAGRTILRNAMNLVAEFQNANEAKTEHLSVTPATVSWQPPCHGHYKVRIDGAVFSKRKQAGTGIVIRDSEGEVIAALSKKWKLSLGALEAEAKAWEMGALFAKEVEIREAEFEGDSLVVCNALQGLVSPPSLVVNVLASFLDHASHLRQWKVSHIKRHGNVPAHLLAQHVVDYVAWLEECPSLIEHACNEDNL
ncbi:putative ribonuclease h protein [Quercus suber]|uniref:Ribonuclease h protein n=1 Tax=Quercus suber TaxID=58331 RepID=A0AAW0L2N8_QUESU